MMSMSKLLWILDIIALIIAVEALIETWVKRNRAEARGYTNGPSRAGTA